MGQQPFIDLNALPDTRVPQASLLSRDHMLAELAHHEAAHAVIGMTRGMSLVRTRVHPIPDPTRDMWSGTTTWAVKWVLGYDFACECAAGSVGGLRYLEEARLLTPETAARSLAPHDRAAAESVLSTAGYQIVDEAPAPERGITWEAILTDTRTAVDEYWPQITALAAAILAAPDHTVSGEQAAAITAIPNPNEQEK